MRKRFILAASFLFLFPAASLMAQLNVLPTPKFWKPGRDTVSFRDVLLDMPADAKDSATVIELRHFFGRSISSSPDKGGKTMSLRLRLAGEAKVVNPDIPAEVADSALSNDEGYVLSSGRRGVEIVSRTKAGIFYGVTTFLQLVEKRKGGYTLPALEIADFPSLRMRGISDDISRGQISTMANFRQIIRFLAMHKMNTYMPYIENLFAFKSYPDFSAGRDPLTREEVAELDAYAKLYHVEIIPVFETLGHLEDVLEKPEFAKYAEFPGAASLNVSSDSAYEFMKTLLSEIAPAFSSPYFNMAADESFDVGLGASKSLVDSVGMAEAHAQYYLKLYNLLKSLGKKVMMYGDIILENPQILSEIPKDITIVDWHYGASFNYPSIKVFRDAGFNLVVCPAVWNFTGPFPNFYNSYANIQNFTRQGYEAGAGGVIVSTWNDNGAAELRELNYPGYAWGAECAWNPQGGDPARFEEIFFRQFFGTKSQLPRIAYDLLSSTNNQITWYEFWRAPFLDPRTADTPLRVESIRAVMPQVIDIVSPARREAKAEGSILTLYNLVARMNLYWADRVSGVARMRSIAGDSLLSPQVKSKEISEIRDRLLRSLSEIRRDYVKAYLGTNRRPMLQLIETRFDEQAAALKAGTEQMLAGNAGFAQVLPSSFIYYPESRPYKPGNNKVDSATFLKVLELGSVPESAEAQLIGDTYCKLYVNGRFVGEVKARRTLTWNVEMKRVKVFNISKFLKKGKNEFVIQSSNFDRNGSAGCNLFALVGKDTLSTDSTWEVAKGLRAPAAMRSQKRVYAAEYQNGWLISAPDFALKLKSWIER